MPDTLIGVVYELVTHAGQVGISHVGKRLDASIPQPPQPPTPPVLTPPTFTPPAFQLPAAAVPVAPSAFHNAPLAVHNDPQSVPNLPIASPTAAAGVSYSDQVAQGIACLNCTRGHVATAKAAAQQAVVALEAGDDTEARRQWAIVAAEYDALAVYDWEDAKLANTPAADRTIIEQVRPCVARARAAVPTPATVSLAYGSATESQRFALSTRFTDRDAGEIVARHEAIDSTGNYAERVQLVNDTSPAAAAAKQSLREARHVLDSAQATNQIFAAETWAQASQHFEAAAVALTPVPTLEEARALAATCTECSETFYRAYFQKQSRTGT